MGMQKYFYGGEEMKRLGYILLFGAFYECGIATTYSYIKALPRIYRNGFVMRYPGWMCFLFPFSLLLNIVPRGFRLFYFVYFLTKLGMVLRAMLLIVAFILLEWPWWLVIVWMILSSVLVSFLATDDMMEVMKNTGPFPLQYLPKRQRRK